jgi:hypothetical protein
VSRLRRSIRAVLRRKRQIRNSGNPISFFVDLGFTPPS